MTPRLLRVRCESAAALASGAAVKRPHRAVLPVTTFRSRVMLAAGCGALIGAIAETVAIWPLSGFLPPDHAARSVPSTGVSLLQNAEVRMTVGRLVR